MVNACCHRLAIAVASGALGLVLSGWIASLLVSSLPFHNIGTAIRRSPDWRILAFTAAVSLLRALLAGVTPALRATRSDPAPGLKNDVRTASLGLFTTGIKWEHCCPN